MTGCNHLPELLQKVVDQIRVLRRYTARTGFHTTRSQNSLLHAVSDRDLPLVLAELERLEQADKAPAQGTPGVDNA